MRPNLRHWECWYFKIPSRSQLIHSKVHDTGRDWFTSCEPKATCIKTVTPGSMCSGYTMQSYTALETTFVPVHLSPLLSLWEYVKLSMAKWKNLCSSPSCLSLQKRVCKKAEAKTVSCWRCQISCYVSVVHIDFLCVCLQFYLCKLITIIDQ